MLEQNKKEKTELKEQELTIEAAEKAAGGQIESSNIVGYGDIVLLKPINNPEWQERP